ncbi:unnamed protein product [Sordaria macrospora k-hell]|uniref:WGS project CABT00000000 data, contig 2.25 n=2 Tax=Sordaria macrospora TaxID=5147 RepID=F7W3L3_SORMK|nr:uncharacterized protein SMAC_05341 [Sordaria macrospora k-hell]KAH7632081.1 hypothetical protein B0T09DRAFT_283337 [Sordaria sp. MPI-SDFR-AT-0083]CCC12269.1 unnamed protein product [Sordaria macrospora k-hell]
MRYREYIPNDEASGALRDRYQQLAELIKTREKEYTEMTEDRNSWLASGIAPSICWSLGRFTLVIPSLTKMMFNEFYSFIDTNGGREGGLTNPNRIESDSESDSEAENIRIRRTDNTKATNKAIQVVKRNMKNIEKRMKKFVEDITKIAKGFSDMRTAVGDLPRPAEARLDRSNPDNIFAPKDASYRRDGQYSPDATPPPKSRSTSPGSYTAPNPEAKTLERLLSLQCFLRSEFSLQQLALKGKYHFLLFRKGSDHTQFWFLAFALLVSGLLAFVLSFSRSFYLAMHSGNASGKVRLAWFGFS